MGLELVELVMGLEDEFGIQIPDAEFAGLTTVGSLIQYIQSRMPAGSSEAACATTVAFHQLRGFLVEEAGVAKDAVRPDVALTGLLCVERRRAIWNKLRQSPLAPSHGWRRLPQLERPTLLQWTGLLLLAGAMPCLFFSWELSLACVSITILGARVTRSLAVHFPSNCQTVRHLVHRLARPRGTASVLSESEVARKVRLVISDCLAIPPERITDEKHFVRDLGC